MAVPLEQVLLENKAVPYTSPVRVKVITIRTDEIKPDGALRFSACLDEASKKKIKEGALVVLINDCVYRKTIMLNSNTKIGLSKEVLVPAAIAVKAQHMINPPETPISPTKEIIKITTPSVVSIEGTIVQVNRLCNTYKYNVSCF